MTLDKSLRVLLPWIEGDFVISNVILKFYLYITINYTIQLYLPFFKKFCQGKFLNLSD